MIKPKLNKAKNVGYAWIVLDKAMAMYRTW